ncbi:MAG: hypothetical protein J6Z30_00565 [Pyramidobacter sp.]|nr:hypothetical protein [Pyramidobacter sp.]
MRERFLKDWPLVVAGTACAVFAVTTAYYQIGLFTRPEVPALPAPHSAEAGFPSAKELSALLAERVQAIAAAEKLNLTWNDDENASRAVYSIRPALRLKGVVVSKGRRCALVAVEGEKNAKIVFEGQIVAGIVFREISQAGCLCRWRGEDFYVPVE